MKRHALLLALCLAACKRNQGSAGSASTPAPGAPTFAYVKAGCDPRSEDCRCNISVDDPDGLKDLDLGAADLKSVYCILGDFDGNGSGDVAIIGKGYEC